MSQKRVATVLVALVGTLTLSSGVLLLMEGGTTGNTPLAAAVDSLPTISVSIEPTAPLRQSTWDYIIIYESGDAGACSASLAEGRITGGSELPPNSVRPKANFHFVIDGAANAGMDGNLEVGTTWQHQIAGAPYAGWPDPRYYSMPSYNNAVGICLAGNSNRHPISEGQTRTLIRLVHDLQARLNIPSTHVLFQWDPRLTTRTATPAQKAFAAKFRSLME